MGMEAVKESVLTGTSKGEKNNNLVIFGNIP